MKPSEPVPPAVRLCVPPPGVEVDCGCERTGKEDGVAVRHDVAGNIGSVAPDRDLIETEGGAPGWVKLGNEGVLTTPDRVEHGREVAGLMEAGSAAVVASDDEPVRLRERRPGDGRREGVLATYRLAEARRTVGLHREDEAVGRVTGARRFDENGNRADQDAVERDCPGECASDEYAAGRIDGDRSLA